MKRYQARRLNLEPAFQRRSVWTKTDRRKLIVSVFDGIPLPSVYLYKRVESSGFIAYDVIDGKQRLESLMLFAEQGPLTEFDGWEPLRFKSTLDDRMDECWRYWDDLSGALQQEFLKTKVPVITVQGQMSEVAELFVSINSTGKKLTGQERRHAFHEHSRVLKVATSLAEQHREFFRKNGVFSNGQMDRMLHIELATELLLYGYRGHHMNKKAKLDEIIRGDDLDVGTLQRVSKNVGQVLKVVGEILPNMRSTRFRRRADFYTLLTLLMQMKADGHTVIASGSRRNLLANQLLTEFGLGVDLVSEWSSKAKSVPDGYAKHAEYLMTVKEGTDSATQRKKRAQILEQTVLANVFDARDGTRNFNEQQRRILWNADPGKECWICQKTIRRWEDMHVDHVEVWIRGGPTDLENGAITHRWCNQRKGAKVLTD